MPVTYDEAYSRSLADPAGYWASAAQSIAWAQPFHQVLDASVPHQPRWFVGGRLNLSYNALDRHVECGDGDKTAIIYDSPVTHTHRAISYKEMLGEVEHMAGVLRAQGVQKGDRVVIYMPMIPESSVAMLACARIGAVHSVVFGGFAAHELAVRIDDAKPKLIIAASCGIEGSKTIPYAPLLEGALQQAAHKVDTVIIFQREQGPKAAVGHAKLLDWATEVRAARSKGLAADPVFVPSEHPSYVLYTSGTTGTPKGCVRDTGGYTVALAHSMASVYGMRPNSNDTWWAASDVGWVVGHSYIVYGPLISGNPSVLYEGKPVGTPDPGEFWRVIARNKVKAMFAAPTAIRAIRKEDPDGHFLREGEHVAAFREHFEAMFLGGERSDPATVMWAREHVGADILDCFWQTETGWPVITNSRGYGLFPARPGSAGRPVPGWDIRVLSPSQASRAASEAEFFSIHVSEANKHHAGHEQPLPAHVAEHHPFALRSVKATPGHHATLAGAPFLPEAEVDELGPMVVRTPLPPGALTGLWNQEKRFKDSYFGAFPGYFSTGDAAMVDDDGYIHIMSRADDVINVAGHRLSTGTLEAALCTHPAVAEAAVIGPNDELKGQVPVALVVLKAGAKVDTKTLPSDLVALIREQVGPVASFRHAILVDKLPKTRSGKTLRATMKAIADGTPYKVPATIDDPNVLVDVEAAMRAHGFPAAKKDA